MVRRDVLGPLPGEGTWDHVLLADGNIGIGGDPLRLLHRAAHLLRPGGTVLVETDPGRTRVAGFGPGRFAARCRSAAARGRAVGAATLLGLAARPGVSGGRRGIRGAAAASSSSRPGSG